MVGNDLKLDEGIGICGKEGQSVPVGVGIPTIKIGSHDRGRHGRMIDPELASKPSGWLSTAARPMPNARWSEGEEFSAHGPHAVARDAEGRRIARARDCAFWWAGALARPTRPIFPPKASANWWIRPSRSRPSPPKIRTPGCRIRPSLARFPAILQLYSDDISRIDTRYRIEQARQTEEAAFAADPRITNSEGASFDAYYAASACSPIRAAFSGSYRTSSCSLSTTPVAREGEFMERDYWYSSARSYAKLESPARDRTARRGANRAPSGRAQSSHAESAGDLRSPNGPYRCSATSSMRSRATPSIAKRLSWRANWASAWRPKTSPSSTTARCPASSALRPSTTKAFRRAARW